MLGFLSFARSRVLWGLIILACLPTREAAAQGFMRSVPTSSYFVTLAAFYDGEYRNALVDFLSEGRGAIKNGPNYWIDSICYNTMAGECYYQLGQYRQALNHYTPALHLYVAFNNWMLRVHFNPVRPAGSGVAKGGPLGRFETRLPPGFLSRTRR